ncbi:MAG: T9SS type A sorting domain-containing protein, partial [candidate division Zixibacteria bacterium]
ETVPFALLGHTSVVNIFQTGSGVEIGAFDLLIQYDNSALTPIGALIGLLPENCGWEYFQYRHGPFGNCGSGCPQGLIRLVAIAETNNGAYHPGCFLEGEVGPLASIEFLVTIDYTLECQFAPINFFWIDCADNNLSSKEGDTTWVERTVYDPYMNNITDHTYGFPGRLGIPNSCLAGMGPGKPLPIRCIDFTNGGIEIVCVDQIDDRGDINLDGLAYTIADAVMLTNYFIHGLNAFPNVSEFSVEGAIAATDVNADGLTLTVADLVYLIRVIVGDAPPMPKPNPDVVVEATFGIVDGSLTIRNATDQVGAIYLLIEGEAEPTLNANAFGMEMETRYDGVDTRVLIYNLEGKTFLEEGAILDLNGAHSIKSIEAGSFSGIVMAARIDNLPRDFALGQNYPNPFNPTTTVQFSLPVSSEWELTIFNILGQQVQRITGQSDAGFHSVEFDGSRFASGVYFYRFMAGDFSHTRKMVLLK